MNKKSILITGASTGIGFSTAVYLAKKGWEVIATVRKDEDKPALEKAGCIVEFLDITNKQQQADLFAKYTRLSAVFLNSGFGILAAVEDCDDETLRYQFDTNFFGTWHGTRLAIKNMRANGDKGHIVICSSVVGYIPLAYRGPYVASKYALEGMVETARLELQNSGIEICSLNPGPILSEFRSTSYKLSRELVDFENSVHKDYYEAQYKRLLRPAVAYDERGTLPAFDCGVLVEKILNDKKTKAKYLITSLAKKAYYARKLLPNKLFEKILSKI